MKLMYGWKTELARISNRRSSVMTRYHGLGWVGDFEVDGADTIALNLYLSNRPGKVLRRKAGVGFVKS